MPSTTDLFPRARRPVFLAPVMLCLLLAFAFSPLLSSGFIDFDDDLYITANPWVQAGLTWTGFKWAWQSTIASNWHPVTWLSHMLDCQIYGLHPWGHHLTSILLHALNSLLLFFLLRRLTRTLWPSMLVAALSALHPLHVESVAWTAERKDVLCATFFLATIWAYAAYACGESEALGVERRASKDRGRSSKASRFSAPRGLVTSFGARVSISGCFLSPLLSYCLSLVFFCLGLMTKPMLVSLPFVLLLLDIWPLGRWRPFGAGSDFKFQISNFKFQTATARPLLPQNSSSHSIPLLRARILLEKVPFFLLAMASGVVTFLVQKQSGAVTQMAKLSLHARLDNALVSYSRYLGKLFWPVNLTLFYPFPDGWSTLSVALSVVLLAVLTAAAILLRRAHPWFLVGWSWFVVMLVPVIGLVQVGGQAMADRYTYLPLIGIFIILGWSIEEAHGESGFFRWPVKFFHSTLIRTGLQPGQRSAEAGGAASAASTVIEQRFFLGPQPSANEKNRGERLPAWLMPLVTGTVAVACAVATFRQARFWRTSETLWSHALAVTRNNFLARINLGLELQRQERFAEAADQFRAAVKLRPTEDKPHANLGNALCREKRVDEGIAEFEEALRLNPNSAGVRHNLAFALCYQKRFDEGIAQFEALLKLRPDSAQTHLDIAMALASVQRTQDAIAHLRRALELRPAFPEAQRQLQILAVGNR